MIIPTYETGKAEKTFLEKRVYQGNSGVVYPHRLSKKYRMKKKDKLYNVVFLENEYIKVMIMPELEDVFRWYMIR